MPETFDKYEAWVLYSVDVRLNFKNQSSGWVLNVMYLTHIIDSESSTAADDLSWSIYLNPSPA